MEDYKQRIKNKLNVVPMEPGCYLMKDRNDQVIYVGKAKKLRNRLRSYFTVLMMLKQRDWLVKYVALSLLSRQVKQNHFYWN